MTRHVSTLAFIAAFSLPGVLTAQHGTGGAARPAVAPAKEAAQFDFLIGQWELVVTPKTAGLAARIHGAPKLVGTWKAWRAVDGFGVEDELRILDRSGNPTALSQALRVYSPTERKWVVTGIDAYRGKTSGSSGEWKNGQMVMSGQGTDEEGKAYITRTRYYDITGGAFKYQQDRSFDNGRTWDEGTLRIEAKRVAATAAR
jgi:hypothetical protein